MNFNKHSTSNSKVSIKPFIICKFILVYNCTPILGVPVKVIRSKMKLPEPSPDKWPQWSPE